MPCRFLRNLTPKSRGIIGRLFRYNVLVCMYACLDNLVTLLDACFLEHVLSLFGRRQVQWVKDRKELSGHFICVSHVVVRTVRTGDHIDPQGPGDRAELSGIQIGD